MAEAQPEKQASQSDGSGQEPAPGVRFEDVPTPGRAFPKFEAVQRVQYFGLVNPETLDDRRNTRRRIEEEESAEEETKRRLELEGVDHEEVAAMPELRVQEAEPAANGAVEAQREVPRPRGPPTYEEVWRSIELARLEMSRNRDRGQGEEPSVPGLLGGLQTRRPPRPPA